MAKGVMWVARLTRSQVPKEQTWNLEDLFPSNEAWESELAGLQESVSIVTEFQGRLGDGASVLLACLEAQETFLKRMVPVTAYASLRSSEDGTNPTNQADSARVASVAAQVQAALSFIDSEILNLPDGTVERYLSSEPGLIPFQKTLTDLLEQKPHRLSPETETVLAALSEVHSAPYTIYQRAKSSDMAFDPVTDDEGQSHPVSFALYENQFEQEPNTALRRSAYVSFVKTLKQYENTFAATYATEVKKQVAFAQLRKYESTEQMLLRPQQVTMEMYHNILDVIQTELAPHMRRLAKLRGRLYGLDTVLHCDLKVPLDASYAPSVTYEEASKMVLEALSALGPEYGEIMETAMANRWVDFADNVGKSTGAFCSSPYGYHSFILLTWTGSMRDAFTLAHELGHAGHFMLAAKNQRLTNTRPSMYFVEAPSTMNERLLAQHILAKSTDPRMRRWVISQSLGTYYHNFVTHLLEAELQRRVYAVAEQGKPITASVLCELKGNVLTDFWGDAVTIDDGARLTWMRQPHYYMGLYPYTYAAGLTASTAVAMKIEQEGQPAVDRWLQTLKAGGTLRPLELMELAGVDMSKPDAISSAVAYVGSLVDELERTFE